MIKNTMASGVRKLNIRDVLQRHQARYEIHPYYVASPGNRKVQAGFDVDLYGTVETWHLPLDDSEEGREVLDYFESVAREIQLKVGRHCMVEIIPYSDSLTLDSQHHFRPLAMLRIRISHDRGLDQPGGPAEDQALKVLQETLRELEVKQT
jgi:hypothetical protein